MTPEPEVHHASHRTGHRWVDFAVLEVFHGEERIRTPLDMAPCSTNAG